MWEKFIRRMQEPSTHAGLSSLVTLAALVGVPATVGQAVATAVVGLTGVAAVFLPESK